MIEEWIPKLVKTNGMLEVKKYGKFIKINFGRPFFEKPKIKFGRNVSTVYPNDCVEKKITYKSDIYIDILVVTESGLKKEYKKVFIGSIPVTVKSNLCNLTTHMRDPSYNAGGYSIIRGNEKIIVSQEKTKSNHVCVYYNRKRKPKYSIYGDIKSLNIHKNHSTLTTVGLIVGDKTQMMKTQIYIVIPYIPEEKHLPIGVAFKALGILEEGEMLKCILPCDQQMEDRMKMLKILIPSLETTFCIKSKKEALYKIGRSGRKYLEETELEEKSQDEKDTEATISYARHLLHNELFPHIGKTDDELLEIYLKKKALYLGYMIFKILSVYIGKRKGEDRDHYAIKRLSTIGELMSTQFFHAFSRMCKELSTSCESQMTINNSFVNVSHFIKPNIITNSMASCLSQNNWGRKKSNWGSKPNTLKGISQTYERFNYIGGLSNARKVNLPLGESRKIIEPRKVHNTHWRIICMYETPEGKKCGQLKSLASTAYVSMGCNQEVISKIVKLQETVYALDVSFEDRNNFTKIFVNGNWIGTTDNPRRLVDKLKKMRRCLNISFDISIAFDVENDEILISTDVGRLMSPIFVVEHGKLLFTTEHADKLRQGIWTWEDLLSSGLVEIIDKQEEEFLHVCISPEDFVKAPSSKKIRYTHCEIHPSLILGFSASIIPYSHHNQAPRNTYQCLDLDESVLMGDRSWKKIKDIRIGNMVVTFDPTTLQTSTTKVIHHFIKSTNKPIFEVSTLCGDKITATHDHKFWTSQGWQEIREFDKNTKVGFRLGQKPIEVSPRKKEKKLLYNSSIFSPQEYFILRRNNLFPLTSKSKKLPVLARVFGLFSCMFFENALRCKNTKKLLASDLDLLGLTSYSLLFKLLKFLGIQVGDKQNQPTKVIPRWIMKGNKRVQREYLAAVYGTAGKCVVYDDVKDCYSFPSIEKYTRQKFLDSAITYMEQILDLHISLNLQVEKQVEKQAAQFIPKPTHGDFVMLSFHIHASANNFIDLYERVGFRYNTNFKIMNGLNVKFFSYLKNSKKYDLNNRRQIIMCRNFFFKHIEQKDDFIFVPILFLKHQPWKIMIADITTESPNHSFIASGFAVHNSSMAKQAIGMPSLDYTKMSSSVVNLLDYPQKPLCMTRMSKILNDDKLPSGTNAVVAVAPMLGLNQEDSLVFNQSSIDRGFMVATKIYDYYRKIQRHKNEVFAIPDEKTCSRVEGNNSKLCCQTKLRFDYDINNYITVYAVKKGERVEKGDILIGVVINQEDGTFKGKSKRNASIVYKENLYGVVERVEIGVNGEGFDYVKISVAQRRPPLIGDKFASRYSQKGTIGMVFRQEDMPFCAITGIVPDIIINPLAFPSRMTISHLIETLTGKAVAQTSKAKITPTGNDPLNRDVSEYFADATSFQPYDRKIIEDALVGCGMHPHGDTQMIDGMSGKSLKCFIFTGLVFYQRLKHQVADKWHSRSRGPRTIITRQPREGRANAGGFRVGPMERDCVGSQGASGFLVDRLMEQSDLFAMPVCQICGLTGVVNKEGTRRECMVCENSKIEIFKIPYGMKLVSQLFATMGAVPRVLTDKYEP